MQIDIFCGVVGCGLWVVGCGLWGCGLWAPHCKFTIFHSKSFFKKSKLDIYKCPFLDFLKYFWEFDVL